MPAEVSAKRGTDQERCCKRNKEKRSRVGLLVIAEGSRYQLEYKRTYSEAD
jgi:hypothetical protein